MANTAINVEWFRMGNLAFYPENGTDARNRFFFFKTLLSEYEKKGREYNELAHQIGNAAVSALGGGPLGQLDQKDSRVVELLKQALDILQAGIVYERANEQKYIQEKIAKIKQTFKDPSTKKLAEIKTIEALLAKLSEGFDYATFINLLNVVSQGLDNTKAIYEFEKEHIEAVNKKYLQAKDAYFSQLDGLDAKNEVTFRDTFPDRTGKRSKKFDSAAEKAYLMHHTYNVDSTAGITRMLRKAMEDTSTIDTILAKKVTEQLNAIYRDKELKSQIWEILQKNKAIINGYEKSTEEIRTTIIVMIEKYVNDNISTFLTEEIDYTAIADKLEEYFENNSEESFELNVRGIYDNFGFYGQHLDFFKNQSDLSTDLEQSATGLYDALVKFRKEVNDKKKKVSDLTTNQKYTRKEVFNLQQENGTWNTLIKLMNQLESAAKKFQKIDGDFKTAEISFKDIDATKEDDPIKITITEKEGKLIISENFTDTKVWKKLGFNSFNPTNLKNAITSLKKRISSLIRDQLNVAFTTAMLKGKEQEARRAVRNALQNLRISIGGPTFNETRQLIAENLDAEAFWSGKLNIKADSIIITAPEFTPDIKLKFSDSELRNVSDEIIDQVNKERQKYQKEYMDAIEADMRQISKKSEFTNYQKLTQNFFNANKIRNDRIEEIREELKLLDADSQELTNLITEQGKESEDILAKKMLLNELENTLYISTTDKTFKHYQNHIGFVGGSIGADIIAQVDNLNFLFSQGGLELTSEERDWLIFAAINNSSLSVVGHKNQDLIETFLGSLAMFALFDEGGAELEILKHNIDDSLEEISASGIMHLYLVNGIYYPGSFVLQQALDNIKIIFSEIQSVAKDESILNNHGIKITNTVSFDDIPNRKKSDGKFTYYSGPTDTNPWQTVSNTAVKKTNLHVVFLAGLLSVIDGLMTSLSDIDLPT